MQKSLYTFPAACLLTAGMSAVLCSCAMFNISENEQTALYDGRMALLSSHDAGFEMGAVDAGSDEQPVHTVEFTYDILMDTIEVTQKNYDATMSSAYDEYTTPDWDSGYGLGDNFPAYSITWHDAALYCNARTKAAGRTDTVYVYSVIAGVPGNGCVLDNMEISDIPTGYSLPSEAEWEFACRGGTVTGYYWGTAGMNDFSWNSTNSGLQSQPAAHKLPNAYGLYDMSGNVFEWCNDWFGSYSSGVQMDPFGPESGSVRVIRGGSAWESTSYMLSAKRWAHNPSEHDHRIGFRCVLRLSWMEP